MSFFSRALQRDIDRLVRESPIPKSIQYDDQEFSNLLHRSYVHHSRPQGPTSVSATAKLQAPSHNSPIPAFNPFSSQQCLPHIPCELNESSQSVAELFNSLKRDASTASAPIFQESSNTKYVGPRNLSIRGRPQGILDYQDTLEDCFRAGGDRNQFDDSIHGDGLENTEDPELEACSLFLWIIKPEPELAAVRVEGKKSLRDDEFWQTGIVTQRLHEKLVKTQSGSVYKLEGNMVIMDTLAAGFSKSVAEAFWLGFPEDWERLIQDHFNRFQYNREPVDVVPKRTLPEQEEICVMEACDEQSDKGEDYAEIMDASEVGLSDGTVEGIIDSLDRDISTIESAGTDGDEEEDLRDNTEVSKPKKKVTSVKLRANTSAKPTSRDRRSGVKEYTLTNWIIKPLPTGQGVHLTGLNQDRIVWSSSAVERRLDKKKLLTSGGSIYKLKGNIDTLMALEKGIPEKVIEKFKTGFPKEWLEIIQEHLNENKSKHRHRSKSRSRGRVKNDHKNSRNKDHTPKCASKPGKKSSASERIIRNKAVTGSQTKQNATISSISSRESSSKKTPKDKVERPANIVFTPNGEVVDLDNLQHSRSGRLIKPPLSQWCGQQIRKGENGYYVTARTEYAKQYCAAIEDTRWNSGKRIRNKYFKQKNKENDTATSAQIKKYSRNSKPQSDKQSTSCDSSLNFQVNMTVESADSDRQDDSYTDLTKEINIVLERHKAPSMRRKSERISTACYQKCQETKTSKTTGTHKDEYTLDESDNEQNVHRIENRKSRKSSENKVNQVSVVSSTTDVRRSRRRSRRLRSIVEDMCSENPNTSRDTVGSSVSEHHNKQTVSRLTENETDLHETVTNFDDRCWTAAEKHRLNIAFKKVDSEDPEFWDKVAKIVRTKSADACQEQFYATEKSELGKRKDLKKDRPKVTALTANKGTLKRKQQLSDILKQHNENYTDNVFDATPFRKTRKRKIDIEGEKCFEETLKRQGKSRFETPKADGIETEHRQFPRMMSEKKTPMSVVTIEENVKSGQTDAYVHNLMKRGVHRKKLKKCLATPKHRKGSKECSNTSPHQRLFISELQNHSDEENLLEEDEDNYWEHDVTTD